MRLRFLSFPLLIILYIIFCQISILDISSNVFYDSEDKLWAHRVLNPDKINSLKDEFIGFEIDVYFDDNNNRFDISHHRENKLDLISFFNAIENINELKFWIDFKNINVVDTELAIKVLNEIALEFDIKSNIIIESPNIILLNKFKINGFFISYWLPRFHFFNSVFNILDIRDNLITYRPNAISVPYSSVSFYSKKFPNYPLHCWTNESIAENDKLKINNLRKRDNVKIILTDFKKNF